MNLVEKLMPHLVFVVALLPTVLLLLALAVSFARPDRSLAAPGPGQAAETCQPCDSPPPRCG